MSVVRIAALAGGTTDPEELRSAEGRLETVSYYWDPNALAYVVATSGGTGVGEEVQVMNTVAISAASLPLPAGAATAARQDTGNTSLDSIDGKLPALEGGRIPVVLPAGAGGLTDDELRADPVEVDGSGVTQPVSGTFWQATQPVSGTFWQATQPISAAALPLPADAATQTTLAALNTKVTAVNTGAVVVSSSVLPSGAATAALQTQPGVDIGDVTINNASIAVTGTFFQATQPVSLAALPALVAGTANIGDVDVLTLPTSGGKAITYVPVAQGAAGATQLAAASGAAKHKVVGCILTMSAAGTIKFHDSSGDLTGAMDVAASGGFVLPTSMLPYFETGAINRSISITTTVGLAKGVVAILTEA